MFKTSPIFGIEYSFEDIPNQEDILPSAHGMQEDEDVVDSGHKSDVFALYCVGSTAVSYYYSFVYVHMFDYICMYIYTC